MHVLNSRGYRWARAIQITPHQIYRSDEAIYTCINAGGAFIFVTTHPSSTSKYIRYFGDSATQYTAYTISSITQSSAADNIKVRADAHIWRKQHTTRHNNDGKCIRLSKRARTHSHTHKWTIRRLPLMIYIPIQIYTSHTCVSNPNRRNARKCARVDLMRVALNESITAGGSRFSCAAPFVYSTYSIFVQWVRCQQLNIMSARLSLVHTMRVSGIACVRALSSNILLRRVWFMGKNLCAFHIYATHADVDDNRKRYRARVEKTMRNILIDNIDGIKNYGVFKMRAFRGRW